MDYYYILLILLFALTAFLYSSVGHGGASGYLAIMALAEFAPSTMKVSALMLNVFVSAISFFYFYKGGHFKWKLFYPFALASIPFAFAGSFIELDTYWYKKVLGLCLIIACLRIFGVIKYEESDKENNLPLIPAFIAGAIIGLISGMIGIGGGILLSPLILLAGWGKLKETAAVSALFIFVNSISGLIPQVNKVMGLDFNLAFLIAALVGGIGGSWWGSKKAESDKLKFVLGLVILIASIKLLTV